MFNFTEMTIYFDIFENHCILAIDNTTLHSIFKIQNNSVK